MKAPNHFFRLLVLALLLSPSLHAAETITLPDTPLVSELQMPPSIMITVDDSNRMRYSFSPDDINLSNPYDGWKTVPEVMFQTHNPVDDVFFSIQEIIGRNPGCSSNNCPPAINDTNEYFKMLVPDLNRLAYDPNVTYLPPPGQSDQTDFTWVGWLTDKAYHHGVVVLSDGRFTFGYYILSSVRSGSLKLKGKEIDVDTAISSVKRDYWTWSYNNWQKCGGVFCPLSNVPANYIRIRNNKDKPYQWVVINYSTKKEDIRVNGQTSIEHEYLDPTTGQWKKFTRTAYQEAVNYANWAAYYRNRMLATKTVMSMVLDDLCKNEGECAQTPYIGLTTINNLKSGIVSATQVPEKLDNTQRKALIKALQDTVPKTSTSSTPLITAHQKLGELFKSNPEKKYFRASCQKAYNIAITDGMYTDNTNFVEVAKQYYDTDLSSELANNVPPSTQDPAKHQHLTLYGLGFATTSIEANFCKDYQSAKVKDTCLAAEASKGKFISSMSIDTLKQGMKSILAEVMHSGGTRAGAAVDTPNLADNQTAYAYVPSFASGWTGNITRYKLNQRGEQEETTVNAADQIKTITPAQRNIFTRNNVAFNYDALNSNSGFSQLLKNLSSDGKGNAAEVKKVIAYLRGDRSNEGVHAGAFRQRNGILGDIVNAAPVVVGAPSCYEYNGKTPVCNFADADYLDFYKSKKNRGTMIYAPMNDGMLHAFDENLKEKWAYIPSVLLRSYDQRGLITLTRQSQADTKPFRHNYYLDATPATFDVRFPDGKWHTVLIGGMGKGGNSYYALDVTEGSKENGKVLWEYTGSNMGYTFGRPLVTRTKATGYDWVAILPSGYNNVANNDFGNSNQADTACVHIVDIKTGQKLKVICADGSRQSSIPQRTNDSGKTNLVAIAGYVADEKNQITTTVYGGDSSGNLWRFDLESNNLADWGAEQLGVLGNTTGKQYVTTEPAPMLVDDMRYVVVGTGGFRQESDLSNTKLVNTVYAFPNGSKDQAGSDDFWQSEMIDLTYNSLTSNTVDPLARFYGWNMDLPEGYHVTTNPVAIGKVVVVAANKFMGVNSVEDRCLSSVFKGMVFAIDVTTGLSVLKDSSGTRKSYIEVDGGIAAINLLTLDDGKGRKMQVAVTTMDGTLHSDDVGTLDLGLEAGGEPLTSGVPQRANLRYVEE